MKATRQAFGEALERLGEKYPDVVVLDADLSVSTQSVKFSRRFPERFFQMGIAEGNMVGTGAGLALAGKIPFVCSFACFVIGRYEQIRMSVAFSNANVKIVGTHAGIGIGEDGYSQMGLEDIALMRPLPNMTIVQPADAVETAQAVEAAIRHEGPLFLRLTRQKVRDLHGEDYTFRLGEADPLRQGSDVAILATGGVVAPALDAADRLAVRGIQAEVTNIHTIQPIDRAYLTACARRFGRIVTVEDHNVIGGLGSAVCDTLAGIHPVPVERIGVEGFGESGDPDELYEKYGFTGQAIAERVERFLRSNG